MFGAPPEYVVGVVPAMLLLTAGAVILGRSGEARSDDVTSAAELVGGGVMLPCEEFDAAVRCDEGMLALLAVAGFEDVPSL